MCHFPQDGQKHSGSSQNLYRRLAVPSDHRQPRCGSFVKHGDGLFSFFTSVRILPSLKPPSKRDFWNFFPAAFPVMIITIVSRHPVIVCEQSCELCHSTRHDTGRVSWMEISFPLVSKVESFPPGDMRRCFPNKRLARFVLAAGPGRNCKRLK